MLLGNVFSQSLNSSFSVDNKTICVGGTVDFSNASVGSITTSTWDFADGDVSVLQGKQSAKHKYTTPGKYDVSLVVISSNGSNSQSNVIIEVLPIPKLNFDITGNRCSIPTALSFDNKSDQNAAYSFSWDFGNALNSSAISPAGINYDSKGKYNISLSLKTQIESCKIPSLTKTVELRNLNVGIKGDVDFCSKTGTSFIAIYDPQYKDSINKFTWNFGDGTFGENNDTVSPKFNKSGSFIVNLKITVDEFKCENQAFTKVLAKPVPVPKFTIDKSKICPNFSVQFQNTTDASTDFVWDFGDGNKFEGKNPGSHLYTKEGDMTVSLSCKGANGCVGTTEIIKAVSVFNPKVSIKSDTTSGCSTLPVQFSDLSTSNDDINNPIVSWNWDFGNGKTFNGKNPSKQFFDVGKYLVNLKIKTSQGCEIEKSFPDFIRVGKIDKVDFLVDKTNNCVNSFYNFSDASTIKASHDESEIIYKWSFSDTTSNSGKNIKQSFHKDTGNVDVKFYITFRGCPDSILKKSSIRILAPLASFKPDKKLFCFSDSQPTPNVSNLFIDKSKLGAKNDSIDVFWDFNDGSQIQKMIGIDPLSNLKGSVSHGFNQFNTYKVKLRTVNYTTGCEDTTSSVFFISWVKPSFKISVDSVCQFSSVLLEDKSTTFALHPLIDYTFDSGEGPQIKGISPAYKFQTFGIKTVKNHPLNSAGCSNYTSKDIVVIKKPIADIYAIDATCSPGIVKYSNISKLQGNGRPFKTFYWYQPEKNKLDSTNDINYYKEIKYDVIGSVYYLLKVKDVFGCVSDYDTAKVLLTKPQSEIQFKNFVCNDSTFIIVDKTKGSVSNTWTIDGNFVGKNLDTIQYKFSDNKTLGISKSHTIELISLDEKKCIDTLRREIIVSMPRPNLKVTFQNLVQTNNNVIEINCPPLISNYYDLTESVGSIKSSEWHFAPKSQSVLTNPMKVYNKPGLYTTTLKSIDEYGCQADTILKDFLNIKGPKGYPVWSSKGDACGQSYHFELKNMENIASIKWDFNDGTLVNDSVSLSHKFQEIKEYKPVVTLTDFFDCKVTYLMEESDSLIHIPETGLDAKFELSKSQVKLGESIQLKDLSKSPLKPLIEWKWFYDYPNEGWADSMTTNQEMYVKYNLYGSKKIRLKIMDQDLCTDVYELNVNVLKDYDMPNIFTPNNDGQNETFSFFDTIFKTYSFYVFDRWGNKIHELNNAEGTYLWDGLNKSKTPMNNGEYFYYLIGDFNDGTKLKKNGFITLIKD